MAPSDRALHFEPTHSVGDPILHLLQTHARPYRLFAVLGGIAAILSPLATLLPIYLVETVIDAILLETGALQMPLVPAAWVPATPTGQLALVAGAIAGLALAGAGFAWIGAWAWGRFAQEVQHAVRTAIYRDVQHGSLAFHEREQSGQVLSILTEDVNQLNQLLERGLGQLVETTARFGCILLLLFLLHWQLALVFVGILPVMALTARAFVVRLRPKHRAVRQHVGALHARLQHGLGGVETVKAYTRESFELERIRRASRALFARRWDVIRTRAKFFPAMSTLNWIGFGVLLVVGGTWILQGPPAFFTRPLEVGTLVSFMLFSQQLTTPVVEAAHLIDQYYDSRASAARILALHEAPRLPDGHDTRPLDRSTGDLSVEDVTFAYPDTEAPVLREVSLDVPAGTFLGIVGATGSGKTTLAKLLLRFYDPTAGAIVLDGRDIRDVPREDLRDQFGVVSQEPVLFGGTVADNIRYGRPEASAAAVRRAAGDAGAHRFITSLDAGYETPVGEGGVRLSGGQRQRISLARALLVDASILLLDEATSHVDPETEAHIRHSLAGVRGDRTVIAIAHRLTTIRHADRIAVLADGQIAETGTHEELLAAGGVYSSMWRRQVDAPVAIEG